MAFLQEALKTKKLEQGLVSKKPICEQKIFNVYLRGAQSARAFFTLTFAVAPTKASAAKEVRLCFLARPHLRSRHPPSTHRRHTARPIVPV